MIRVCGVFGTWQLITLVASLQQAAQDSASSEEYEDYLLLYETAGVSQEFKETLHNMAEAVWPWKRIVWAYDLLLNERRLSQREFDRLCRTIRERLHLSADAADELWICFLTRPAEKRLFAAFPGASLVLYEDGLMTYLEVPLAPLDSESQSGSFNAFRDFVQKRLEARFSVARFRRSRWDMDSRDQARLRRAYLLLSKNVTLASTLSHIPARFVEDDLVRRALNAAAKALPENAERTWNEGATGTGAASARPRVLILGQALSRNKVMSREEEAAFYRRVVAAVLEKGYVILWKDHPRLSEPFFEELRDFADARQREATGQVTRLNLPHAYPVEIVADRLNLAGCVAGTSAALFYLRRLYHIPCYTFAEELLPRMRGADVFMNDMVRREIPPLDKLPFASDAARTSEDAARASGKESA